jgi:glycolate oxidase FAD binding subunit
MPGAVATPSSARDLAAVLRAANDQGLAVLPRGGGSKLDWGNPPTRADLVVSTSRLSRVLDHAWSDMTVSVEAGCPIHVLQQTLGERGQRLAVDPLWPGRATIGGAMSVNDTGALRLAFGGWRDLVIGVTVALADGTLATAGGRVVKNVAGYDLSKLVTGALGTLGVITSAIFRVHPLPKAALTLTASVDADDTPGVFARVLDSTLAPSGLQARLSSRESRVDVLFEGTVAGIAAQAARLREVFGSTRVDEGPADLWTARQALWTDAGPAVGLMIKLSVRASDIGRVLATIRDVAAARSLDWRVVWYGTGIGWLRLDGEGAGLAAAVGDLRSAVATSGSLFALRIPPGLDALETWGDVGDAQSLMTAVRQQFDPKRTLNPGRFVRGT